MKLTINPYTIAPFFCDGTTTSTSQIPDFSSKKEHSFPKAVQDVVVGFSLLI